MAPCLNRLQAFATKHPCKLIGYCACGVLLFLLLNIGRFLVYPSMDELESGSVAPTSFMRMRMAQWQAEEREVTLQQTWMDLNHISPHLRRAVVVAEDSTFWEHQGFDWDGMRIAFAKNREAGAFSAGGSTITQQLAKNLFLSPQKSLTRKVQEAILAWRLEKNLEKERILELYLNVVEWGDGIFGAEAAARHYFGTSAAKLSKKQAATLASMLPAPLVRTPDSNRVRKVSNIIYRRM